jgi:hypothetical protein
MIMMKNVDAFGIEEDGGRSVGWGVGGCSNTFSHNCHIFGVA